MIVTVKPIAGVHIQAPNGVNFGAILLPPAARTVLDEAIQLTNTNRMGQWRLALIPDAGGEPPSVALTLHFDHGTLNIPLESPFTQWVGPLTAGTEIYLTTNTALVKALHLPPYKQVRLNRRTLTLLDTVTYPLKWSLRQHLPGLLRQLGEDGANPAAQAFVTAFERYLHNQSQH